MVIERLPREEWTALIPQAHPGYITWEEFEENQRRLRENAHAIGGDRRRSPPREGPALLQGLALCGRCGDRMTVRYHRRHGTLWPTYVCQRRGIARGEPICQSVPGRGLDDGDRAGLDRHGHAAHAGDDADRAARAAGAARGDRPIAAPRRRERAL